MKTKIQQSLENIIPFLMLGIGIALVIGLFILFSYVLVWGLIIGAVLWVISFVKAYFLPNNTVNKQGIKMKGRVIEHDDKN